MTPFTVDWSPGALDDLADIWNRAPDRNAVTAAEKVIERLLARNPTANGHHLGEGLYELHEPPLKVYYAVDQARRAVEVSQANYRP